VGDEEGAWRTVARKVSNRSVHAECYSRVARLRPNVKGLQASTPIGEFVSPRHSKE
jgi:hypothetical protein